MVAMNQPDLSQTNEDALFTRPRSRAVRPVRVESSMSAYRSSAQNADIATPAETSRKRTGCFGTENRGRGDLCARAKLNCQSCRNAGAPHSSRFLNSNVFDRY